MRLSALWLVLAMLAPAAPAWAEDAPNELIGDVAAIRTANRWGENTNRIYEIYDQHRADLELAFAWAHNEMAVLNLAEALEPTKVASDSWVVEKFRQIRLTREALAANEGVLAVKFASLRQDIEGATTPGTLPASHALFFQDMLRLTEEAYAADIDVDRLLMNQVERLLQIAHKAKRTASNNGQTLRFADASLQARWNAEQTRTRNVIRHLPATQAALFPDTL